MSGVSNIREYQRESASIVQRMAQERALRAKLQSEHTSTGVKAVVNELLAEHLDSGQILTRLLRLPPLQRMLLLEYVHGDGAYRGEDPKLFVTLMNNSDEPVTLLMGKTWHPDINYETDEELPTGTMELHEKTVGPGETITMPAERASGSLYRYCKAAWIPEKQQAWPHDHDCLVEVGYEYTLNGDTHRTPKKRASK